MWSKELAMKTHFSVSILFACFHFSIAFFFFFLFFGCRCCCCYYIIVAHSSFSFPTSFLLLESRAKFLQSHRNNIYLFLLLYVSVCVCAFAKDGCFGFIIFLCHNSFCCCCCCYRISNLSLSFSISSFILLHPLWLTISISLPLSFRFLHSI